MPVKKRPNVGSWLQAEVTGSRIYVRSTPSNRHSGQGWECLKLTRSRLSKMRSEKRDTPRKRLVLEYFTIGWTHTLTQLRATVGSSPREPFVILSPLLAGGEGRVKQAIPLNRKTL